MAETFPTGKKSNSSKNCIGAAWIIWSCQWSVKKQDNHKFRIFPKANKPEYQNLFVFPSFCFLLSTKRRIINPTKACMIATVQVYTAAQINGGDPRRERNWRRKKKIWLSTLKGVTSRLFMNFQRPSPSPPSPDPQGAALSRLSSSHHTLSLSEDWNFPERERVEKIPNTKKWLQESWFLDSISPFFF